MFEEKTINISFNDLSAWQSYLNDTATGDRGCVKKFTAVFTDGVEVDIKVCNSFEGTPFVEPILFRNGRQIGELDVRDRLAGEYIFSDFRQCSYVVNIPDTIELAKEKQEQYRAIKEYLHGQKDEQLKSIEEATRPRTEAIDRDFAIDVILGRCDDNKMFKTLCELATLKSPEVKKD